MHPGLVALSASAITAIYVAGYIRTQAADASIGADATTSPNPSSALASAPPTAVPTPTVQPAPSGRGQGAGSSSFGSPPSSSRVGSPAPTSPPAATAPQPAASSAVTSPKYVDGTYTGQGTSRRGDVWVSVTVQSGRITAVDITRSTLQYPLRDIANLPNQVVERQSAQVDTVSRATYSSQAFRVAVSQALSKAVGA